MSLPISQCLIIKAILNKPKARDTLRERIDYNKKFGAFTLHQCLCSPRCVEKLTDSKIERFQTEEPLLYKFIVSISK